MTYAELIQKIRDYTEVGSEVLTSTILNGFIRDSEFKIFRNTDADYSREYATSSFTANNKYLTLPNTNQSSGSTTTRVALIVRSVVVTNSSSVKMEHLEWALDRTLMGYGKSRLVDEECNRNTAYHEAGHVLVAYFTKDSHPLHKVTILPRGKYFDEKSNL